MSTKNEDVAKKLIKIKKLLEEFKFLEAEAMFRDIVSEKCVRYVDREWFYDLKLKKQAEQRVQAERERNRQEKERRERAERERRRQEKERQERAERERQERAERERRRQEKEKALEKIRKWYKSDFLGADGFYKQQYSEIISYEEYEAEKVRFVQSWIKDHTKTDIDDEQAAAIASYGKHIQVIARAGSGKTRTLVNRAIFLQKHCRIPPNQLILLAFNKDAAEQIKKQLGKYFKGSIPHVMTFHALAYAIVHPKEALLYDDPANNSLAKSQSLQSVIDDFLRDPKFKDKIRLLMLEHFRADWERIILGGYDRDKTELMEYRRSLPKVSLNGEYLKSYGEKLIADFLFEHNIPYNYEKNHRRENLNYRPDFTVYPFPETPKSGIIVEYFGLRGDPDYDEQMEEKRKYWQQKPSWRLVEITPNNVSGGRKKFFFWFKKTLEKEGVHCSPLTEDEIWDKIKDRAIDGFTKTVVSFIQRCRKLSMTFSELADLINSRNDLSSVEMQFLEIAQHLYRAYLERLSATGEEDFDGLMQRAASNIRAGQTIFERKSGKGDLADIRYMFIDEYQDFSDLFLKLVDAIRSQNNQIECFCVGDDWQAINGFAGSDLRFYENFQNYFSPFRELYISTNYRSSQSIVALGNALMKYEGGEPAKPYKPDSGTILFGYLDNFSPSIREKERHQGDDFTPAILRLVEKLLSDGKNIVLLSRKNTLPWYINYGDVKYRNNKNNLDIFCEHIRSYFSEELRSRIFVSTPHKYKGLQSTAVIVVDAVFRSYPLIHPNWIFTRIFGDSLEKITEEEKRLFYVALTRAVDTLIILTETQNISPFLQNIIQNSALQKICWKNFSEVKDKNSRVTVRIGNLNPRNINATLAIKDQLKADNFQWDSRNRVWQQSFLEEKFSLNILQKSIWSKSANEISVRIVDEHESLLEEYEIHSGQWSTPQ